MQFSEICRLLGKPLKTSRELYHRDEVGNWTRTIFEKEDLLKLNSVGLTLSVREIYEDFF